jgi:hypothetical protein
MEYAEGYKETTWDSGRRNFARISLLRLALFCNISHTDPTTDNILVNSNNHTLLLGLGSIDGKEKISDIEKNAIIDELKNGNYGKSLKLLCNKMFEENNEVDPHYGNPDNGRVDTSIDWVHSVKTGDISQLKPLVLELLSQYNNLVLLQPENLQKGGNKKKHSIKKHSIKKHSIKKHIIKKHSIKKHIIKNKT